jgi:putative aldouronate transport system permease protein
MKSSKSTGERIFEFFVYIFLALLSIVAVYPFLYVLLASFSNPTLIMRHRGLLIWPQGYSIAAFVAVFKNPNILSGYQNTAFNVVVGTFLNVFLTSLAAYALSRKTLMMRGLIMKIMVFTMVFQGGMIPAFLLINKLGLFNSRWALLLPVLINTYNFIIMRTAFSAIPDSLVESARLDGANEFVILFRVVFPLSLPTIAVITLYYAVYHWNAWFNASIYLRNRDLFPLQLILREILIQNDVANMTTGSAAADAVPIGETIKYASIIVSTLPILLAYPLLQKYFIKGVMIGAVKG